MQEYAYLIPVIVVIWVMLIGMRIGAYLDAKAKKEGPKAIPEKRCPAHKWAWEEQPGMENTYFMRCQWCWKTPREISDS